jgi:hypothetical protein
MKFTGSSMWHTFQCASSSAVKFSRVVESRPRAHLEKVQGETLGIVKIKKSGRKQIVAKRTALLAFVRFHSLPDIRTECKR